MSNIQEMQVLHLQEFSNSKFGTVRTVQVENQPYFVGKDVAKALGYTKPRNAILQHVDNEDALKQGIPDNQGLIQKTTIINESGVYSLIFGSKLPQAKAFKKWVTSEVLPTIRQTGGYIATRQDDTPEMIMAKALQVAQQTIDNHKQQLQIAQAETSRYKEEVKELTPKAQYTDEVLQSTSTYTFTQVAHDLGLRSVYVLTKFLKEKKIIFKQSNQWQPTAKVADKGYFDTRTAKYVKSDDTIGTSISTVVTEKGRQYLHNLFTNEN